jgi:iron-sulfur cluster assembly protein
MKFFTGWVIPTSKETPDVMETEAQTTSQNSTPSQTRSLALSARAVEQVKHVMKSQGFEGYFFAVRVAPSGCSGFGYDLNLVKEAKEGDIVWEQDGIKLTTDALSERYLAGTEVDFVSGLQGEGFKFSNPNAKSSCGCGQSFST